MLLLQLLCVVLSTSQGLLDDSVPLPRAIARAMHAQKGSGLKLAEVPADARKASSVHNNESLGQHHHSGSLREPEHFV